jgi:hypothetical protein
MVLAPAAAAGEDGGAPSWTERPLPGWLSLGGELRGRVDWNPDEGGAGVGQTRLRFDTTVEPVRWVRFHFQGQDSRTRSFDGSYGPSNAFDVRHVHVEAGRADGKWRARAGRQELAIGDERLVGADADWDPLGPVFDAVRLWVGPKRARFDVFTGFLVKQGERRPDPFDGADRISGASVRFELGDGSGRLEPYALRKNRRETLDLMGRPGRRDVLTTGVRAVGRLPRDLDYNVEMAAQRGRVAADRISSWAGHWELAWAPMGSKSGPRLSFEYNFASGDADPSDGRHGTFDDLYPAGFNRYGISDPFAWRNIRYPGVGIELPVSRQWTLLAGYRDCFLVDVRDGLYGGGDEFLFRNAAATGSRIGSHVLFSAAFTPSARWRVHAGYGQFFKGTYLRQSGYDASLRSMYVLTSFTF